MKEKELSNKHEDEGWEPNAPSGKDAIRKEERSLDIGEAGQFAPGGYYNQQTTNQPNRSTIDDDDVVPPGRR
jgi:hypothetical protein